MTINIVPIATIHTPYTEKFAIPRQPGLAKSAVGEVKFLAEFNDPNYLRGIEQFSHLWLIFHFHQTADKGHTPLIRPPRLGGNKKLGVFASRSTFRPNGLGMSVVEFSDLEFSNKQLILKVKGVDLLDGTPIVDIKPYLPYADQIATAQAGIAQDCPDIMPVVFSDHAATELNEMTSTYPNLRSLIQEVLSQDPRPAYHQQSQPDKTYGMTLYNVNIQWQVKDLINLVLSVQKN